MTLKLSWTWIQAFSSNLGLQPQSIILKTKIIYWPKIIPSGIFELLAIVNDFSHVRQLYGFSPLCILSCTFRAVEELNASSQLLHVRSFFLLWSPSCFLKTTESANDLPHSLHEGISASLSSILRLFWLFSMRMLTQMINVSPFSKGFPSYISDLTSVNHSVHIEQCSLIFWECRAVLNVMTGWD